MEPETQKSAGHAAFLKRNSGVLADILSAALRRPTPKVQGLLEELTILVATRRTSQDLDGRIARSFRRIFARHQPAERAAWDAKQWHRMLRLCRGISPGALDHVAALHGKLQRRHDFPSLDSMRKRGLPSWRTLFEGIGSDPGLASVVTSLLLNREELPGGPELRQLYLRLGFSEGEDGRPPRLAVLPEALPVLKWAFPQLVQRTCKPETVPGTKDCAPCPLRSFCLAYRRATTASLQPSGPTLVDIFAGGGGLSLGLTHAGMKLLLAVEIEGHAADTLYLNHPEAPNGVVSRADVRRLLHRADFLEKFHGVDVLAGGPPCQPFSMARRHSRADQHDPRRHLFHAFLDLAGKLKPRIVIMENVPGILTADRGRTLEGVLKGFAELEYEVGHVLLNAADHGVPQNRQRVFFIGVNRARNRDAKEALTTILSALAKNRAGHRTTTLQAAISGIPRIGPAQGGMVTRKMSRGRRSAYGRRMARAGRFLFNHESRAHNPRDIRIFSALKWGETADELERRQPNTIPYQLDSFGDKYRRLHPHRPAPTIPAHLRRDANSFVHPFRPRGITGREAARLQSFPDDYVFLGGFGPAFVQIGNAVPPLLAETVGKAVMSALANGA